MSAVNSLKIQIEKIFNDMSSAQFKMSIDDKDCLYQVMCDLDHGKLRVVSRDENSKFTHNEWLKKAILIYFKTQKMGPLQAGDFNFYDKVPVKKWTGDEGVRVVPPAFVRFGSYVARGAILMPSFVNIGAYVDEATMIDTWATVGSCAYVGKNVHVSGGVGIGGVLEPLQATPVIIEDDCFIGSRSILVEGVHIESGAVIGAGVTITGSSKIIDVTGNEPIQLIGRIPARSVVIPGSVPKQFAAGSYNVTCALIIGSRKASTDKKTSLNNTLREFNIT